MSQAAQRVLDLTRDVSTAHRLSTTVEQVDELLSESLEALGALVPFDLATIMELEGQELKVRVARGSLASTAVGRHRLRLSELPALRDVLASGNARAFSERDHQVGDAFDGVLDLPHGHSCMVVPLRVRSQALGVMTLDRRTCGRYAKGVVELASAFGKLLAAAMSYGEQSTLLGRLRDQLREQNRLLSERVDKRSHACSLLEESRSPSMQQVVRLARQVAVTDTPVLVTGETGTGKEVLANAIHGWSSRSSQPLISLNCAALPGNLIESELFGHVRGAFSGATGDRMGRFQAANGGTLFLDEVAELPMDLQAKLLRAVQEGCFQPVGSDRTVRVDVRIVAATNVDLPPAVAAQRFREDLYYRLAVFPIHMPLLRARREDVAVIARSFLRSLAERTGRGPWRLDEGSVRWLEKQVWRGNVRELVNHLERATILCSGPSLDVTAGGATPRGAEQTDTAGDSGGALLTLEEVTRRQIGRALKLTGGRIYGQGGSAELLGINPSTLRSRMKKLGLGGARSHRS
ncbi:sigma 54-interacting transcriptional regulator [Planctomycetota bacterium]